MVEQALFPWTWTGERVGAQSRASGSVRLHSRWVRRVEQEQEKKGNSIRDWRTLKDPTAKIRPYSGNPKAKLLTFPQLLSKGKPVCQCTSTVPLTCRDPQWKRPLIWSLGDRVIQLLRKPMPLTVTNPCSPSLTNVNRWSRPIRHLQETKLERGWLRWTNSWRGKNRDNEEAEWNFRKFWS